MTNLEKARAAIRRWREEKELSLSEASAILGYDPCNLSAVESGRRRPPDWLKRKLVRRAGIPIGWWVR